MKFILLYRYIQMGILRKNMYNDTAVINNTFIYNGKELLLNEQIKKLEMENNLLKLKNNKLEQDYNNIVNDNNKLEVKYNNIVNTNNKFIKNQKLLMIKHNNLLKKNKALKQTNNKLVKNNNNLKKINKIQETTIENLTKLVKEQSIRIDKLETQVIELKQENKELKQEIVELKDTVNDLILKDIEHKFIIALIDENKFDDLKKNLPNQRNNLTKLNVTRVYYFHYIYISDKPLMKKYKRSILLDELKVMNNNVRIRFDNNYPNLINDVINYITPLYIKPPTQQIIDDINRWWKY